MNENKLGQFVACLIVKEMKQQNRLITTWTP